MFVLAKNHSLVTAVSCVMFANPYPNKDNIASKTCPCITAFVSVPIRWQALRYDNWICSILQTPAWWSRGMICTHLYSSVTILFISFLPLRLPLLSLSLLLFSSLSLVCFFLSRLSFVAFQVFLSTDANFSLRSAVFFSHSHSPSLPLSFALCVRVCRWLLLAGSVTRGNWGRVHFNRTNGNKLIRFHCCF